MLILVVIRTQCTVTKAFVQGLAILEIKKTNQDHPNYSIVGIRQNTKMSLGE